MDCSPEYIKMCDCEEVQGQANESSEFWVLEKEIWIDKEGYYWLKGDTWLPTQDQIQEMLAVGCNPDFPALGWIRQLFNFVNYGNETKNNSEYLILLGSIEQIWLAFYMDKTHSKVWDGERWVDRLVLAGILIVREEFTIRREHK